MLLLAVAVSKRFLTRYAAKTGLEIALLREKNQRLLMSINFRFNADARTSIFAPRFLHTLGRFLPVLTDNYWAIHAVSAPKLMYDW
ncbi:hypothetical protein PsdCFBP2356_20165 [Pseudomonas syringae pv. dysoxyli]|uniref:hypothetical protein n=1 Tax=Pseudomonas syringae TaxID=317 RepID=UPI0013734B26|nr:hypothetical protein [Pseudomonas syringae]NAO28835.1 hypothetical protein [Pseudomonas syringae pv. dysoxyli]